MEKNIKELRYFNKNFPREALSEAIENKEKITPILLEELDKIIAQPEIVTENEDYMLHVYAMYLLAQFREKEAFTKIIDLISFTPDEVEIIFGDVLTGGLSSILYSTFDGDLNVLKGAIENPLMNIYARGATLDVYEKLYLDGEISKEDSIKYLRELTYGNYHDVDSALGTYVQRFVINQHFFEMIDDIQFLYDQNRIDISMAGQYDDFIDYIYCYDYDEGKARYMDDIIKEMYRWSCFEKTEEEKTEKEKEMKELEKLYKHEKFKKQEKLKKQMIGKPKKIGRNDPCPCGSGEKHKKCCLERDSQIEAQPKNEFTETLGEQKKWLRDYPAEEGVRRYGEIRIRDTFDRESIEIDKLVYLALHYRAIPIWRKRGRFKEGMIVKSYLIEAFEKFLSKCEKEGIDSFDEYDRKYKIHYKSKEWIEILESRIRKKNFENEHEDLLKKIENIISSF